jgi:hypothetical protein
VTSDELVDSVHEALQGALPGCFIDGFVAMVNFIDPDGERRHHSIVPDEQYLDRTMSMVGFLNAYYTEVQRMTVIDMLTDRDDLEDDAD